MTPLSYQLSFHAPAFLGNAEQSAQWRTPPIKALLRQWWRVAYAADQSQGLDLAAMRRAEGLLFGHAWLEQDRDSRGRKVAARRSEIRLRLNSWERGKLSSWDGLEQPAINHREVERTGCRVGPHAYLGYGPLDGRGGTKFGNKVNAAIKDGEHAVFSLAVPTGEAGSSVQRALALMNLYGTLGGRSRNGWGSFSLTPLNGTPALAPDLPRGCTLPWRDALVSDWAQAIGSDERGVLVWQTRPAADWKQAMVQLAKAKIALRTQFRFPHERSDGQVHDRHWLSYPVTNHAVSKWGNNARLPNSLRFKVRPSPGGTGVFGVIFHMPCLPPPAFRPDPPAIRQVWQRVHQHLDADPSLKRIAA
jgi:CRISPR-associated protein Cmr1